ncbi:MAG: TolC family protein [Bacteroidota bacterium]
MKILKYICLLLLVVTITSTQAQSVITIEKAIEIALENNFSIKMAKNNYYISQNNNSLGNAGFLPDVALNVAQSNSVINTKQTFVDGRILDRDGAKSNSLNAGIGLSWTIFDGMKMFTTADKLKELEKKGDLQVKQEVLNVVSEVILNYNLIVASQQQIKVLQQSILLSNERLKLAEDKLTVGTGSKYDLLQAKFDKNADESKVLQQSTQLSSVWNQFKITLGVKSDSVYIITDTLITLKTIDFNTIKKKFDEENLLLQQSEIDKKVAALEKKEVMSARLPSISLNGGYNFLQSTSQAGFLAANQNLGFNYGASLTYPLFDGFNLNRKIQNAELLSKNYELANDYARLQLNNYFVQLYTNYTTSLNQVKLEESNALDAKEILDLAAEKYKNGLLSTIEFRDAQLNFLSANDRLISAKMQAKQLEVELLKMSNSLP